MIAMPQPDGDWLLHTGLRPVLVEALGAPLVDAFMAVRVLSLDVPDRKCKHLGWFVRGALS